MLNEADTCTRYIVPKLREAGWDTSPHSFNEQQLIQITDGRIVVELGTRHQSTRECAKDMMAC